jgi:5-methyltetrahydrofolate--homocysteine methyltransferase
MMTRFGFYRGKERDVTPVELLLKERILILDGAMGTMIQQRRLDEAAFRGERFRDWKKDVKGHNDLLNLTQPAIIEGIHRQYLEAGADIVETNTFNSQAISLSDYLMPQLAYELSRAGAECARRAVVQVQSAQPQRRCFVAGAIGPTTKTSSISTDVNNPAARGATYDELVTAYADQVRGLLDGGADLLLVETIFDTLNAKAAFFAIQQLFAAGARRDIHSSRQRSWCNGSDGGGVLELDLTRTALECRDELRPGSERDAPAH